MDDLYVIIGSDHGGFELKEITGLNLNNHSLNDKILRAYIWINENSIKIK